MNSRQLLTILIVVSCTASSTMLQAGDLQTVTGRWIGLTDDPLFTGRCGQWDALIRERGWVMKDGDTWKLWYTGYNKDLTPVQMKMGYATSPDGIKWTRWSDAPIFDDVWIEDMTVIKRAGRYYMFAEGARDQPQLLESDDGIHWTLTGKLDVRMQDGTPIKAGPHGTPTVLVKDDVWHLFYERYDAGIWLATSNDRRTWTNVSDEPLIVPGPDRFDKLMIAMNQVLEIDGRYIAVMHGTGTPQKPRQWCTYFAESKDLRNWTKMPRGPVLPVKDNKSSGMLVHDGATWRLYTLHGRMDLWFPDTSDTVAAGIAPVSN